MIDFPYMKNISRSTSSKIVMLVVDGLGGLPHPNTGKSELETASLPNLNNLAKKSACGLTNPILPGITPGSGPGHMALFGYDPVKYLLGRGILEALGIGLNIGKGDIASRGNFCTVDSNGILIDRRAGRISTEDSAPLIAMLNQIQIPEANTSVHAVQDYRFVLILNGSGLEDEISETDPQVSGMTPNESTAISEASERTSRAVNAFVSAARDMLKSQDKANMVILRGFSRLPNLPNFGTTYNLRPAAVAAYPMYRGLSKIVGMKVLSTGQTFNDELNTLERQFDQHDFFFLHYKPADSAGEDGNFESKIAQLEKLDACIPRLIDITQPETLIITGDHSTPSIMGSHSWHPVPLMVNSILTKGEGTDRFSEKEFRSGSLGCISATNVMMLALAHAGKLSKFGP